MGKNMIFNIFSIILLSQRISAFLSVYVYMKNIMKISKLLFALSLFLSFTVVSCKDDDEPSVPVDAISVNMIASDGETTIGGSDVYISSHMNFSTSQCAIADLGKKGGFDKNPSLTQIGQEVAVTPGHFYQIFLTGNIRTIAGARAVPVDVNFYNVYVDSWIYDKDKNAIGAKVSYSECYPRIKQLPEWGTAIDLPLKPKNSNDNTEVAEYSFPKGCVIDGNIDVSDFKDSYMKDKLNIIIEENSISFSNDSWTPGGKVQVVLSVRYESTYTRVIMNVESTKKL